MKPHRCVHILDSYTRYGPLSSVFVTKPISETSDGIGDDLGDVLRPPALFSRQFLEQFRREQTLPRPLISLLLELISVPNLPRMPL